VPISIRPPSPLEYHRFVDPSARQQAQRERYDAERQMALAVANAIQIFAGGEGQALVDQALAAMSQAVSGGGGEEAVTVAMVDYAKGLAKMGNSKDAATVLMGAIEALGDVGAQTAQTTAISVYSAIRTQDPDPGHDAAKAAALDAISGVALKNPASYRAIEIVLEGWKTDADKLVQVQQESGATAPSGSSKTPRGLSLALAAEAGTQAMHAVEKGLGAAMARKAGEAEFEA